MPTGTRPVQATFIRAGSNREEKVPGKKRCQVFPYTTLFRSVLECGDGKTAASRRRWVRLSRAQSGQRPDDHLPQARRLRGVREGLDPGNRADPNKIAGLLRDAQSLASGGLAADGR